MLLSDDVQRPQLSILELDQRRIWAQSRTLSEPVHRWNTYLNQLALTTLWPWLETDPPSNDPSQSRLAQAWPSLEKAARLWRWLNGTAVDIPAARLILIPTDSIDTSEFVVPQEWVDIPTFVGDYYLLVQLNPDAQTLQLRGYSTHRRIKQGRYSAQERTYSIDETELIQDLDLLWVMAPLEPIEMRRTQLAPLPQLSQQQVASLLEGMNSERSSSHIHTPDRLRLTFQDWGAILNSPRWQSMLHKTLRPLSPSLPVSSGLYPPAPSPTTAAPVQETSQTAPLPPVAQLRKWLQGQVEATWQTLEQLQEPRIIRQPASAFRAATSTMVSRGRRIHLENLDPPLILLTTILAESDGRLNIRVQLHPPSAEEFDYFTEQRLPNGIQLVLRTPEGECLQVITAREEDDYIQLQRFKVWPGQGFNIDIRFDGQTIQERFQA